MFLNSLQEKLRETKNVDAVSIFRKIFNTSQKQWSIHCSFLKLDEIHKQLKYD